MLHVPKENPKLTRFVKAHSHCPMVDLSMNDPSIDLPRLPQDNQAIGRMGAEHLASFGCRHLGFVIHKPNHFHQERFEGFKEAAERIGLPAILLKAPSDFVTHNSRANWLLQHLPAGDPTFGVMAAADLSIPEDVALLGVDNCREICELAPVAVSSIGNNAFQHGYRGDKLLNDLISGGSPPEAPICVPTGTLYVRQSTSILATRHPHVATVLRYISDHSTDPMLSREMVAWLVPMSERWLHNAFVK
jgi:LacI family transcriptional regulator